MSLFKILLNTLSRYYYLRADILIPCIIYTPSLIKLSNKMLKQFNTNTTTQKKNINFDIKLSQKYFHECIFNLY